MGNYLIVDGVEVYGIIYKILNKDNGKLYIGQTTRKNGFNGRYNCKGIGIERVYNLYVSKRKSGDTYNKYLLSSIEKYGFDNFEVDEIFDIAYTKDELNNLEYMYIAIYNCMNREYGYNFRAGGDNYTASADSRVRMGTRVVCLNDGKQHTSISAASIYYRVPESYVIKTLKKSIYGNINNVSILRFKSVKYKLKEYEYICACCGIKCKKVKVKDKNKYIKSKYCDKCKLRVQKNMTKNNKNKKYNLEIKNMKKLYLWKDVKVNMKIVNYKNDEIVNRQLRKEYLTLSKDLILNMYNDGKSVQNIVDIINLDYIDNQCVKNTLSKLGIKRPDPRTTDKNIRYMSVFKNDVHIELFKYKWECVEWLIKNDLCMTNSGGNSIINKCLKNNTKYKQQYSFKLETEDYYNNIKL